MDRQKLNRIIYNVCYKTTLAEKIIIWIIIGAGFLVPTIAVIRLILKK